MEGTHHASKSKSLSVMIILIKIIIIIIIIIIIFITIIIKNAELFFLPSFPFSFYFNALNYITLNFVFLHFTGLFPEG